MSKWHIAMQDGNGWNSLYLENHDQPRSVSRYGNNGAFRDESTRLLALFHISLAGTVYIYQGQELGMINRDNWDFEDLRDVESINYYNEVQNKRAPEADMSDILHQIRLKGRDNARTPVHWTSEKYAGFSTHEPWIPMMRDYERYNALDQVGREGSHWEWYKFLLRFRKENKVLIYGRYEDIESPSQIYAFRRWDDERELHIICNFSDECMYWDCDGRVLVSTHIDPADHFRPWEARILEID